MAMNMTIRKDHTGRLRVSRYGLERCFHEPYIEDIMGNFMCELITNCSYADVKIGGTRITMHTDKYGHKIMHYV